MFLTPFYQALLMTLEDSEYDSISNLLKLENVRCLRAKDFEEGIKILNENRRLNLIILSDCENIETCQAVLEYIKSKSISIPTIVITDKVGLRLDYLESGAFRVLQRPIDAATLLFTSKNFMKYSDSYLKLEAAENIIFALSRAIEARDTYTQGHSRRVAEFSMSLYDGLGLKSLEDRESLYVSCLLHDIGKIGVPDRILKSKYPLTEKQRTKINLHPTIGFNICKALKGLNRSLDVVLHHHEKLDGSGYPKGLEGDKVPLLAQIVVIADIFDAITTKRTYHDPQSDRDAIKIMEKEEVQAGKINRDFFEVFKYNILNGENNGKSS